jgi:hypothetical protein
VESESVETFIALFTLVGASCLCLLPPALVLLIAFVMSRDSNKRITALEQQVADINSRLRPPEPPATEAWPPVETAAPAPWDPPS